MSIFKHPRTTQEKRLSCPVGEELEPRVRAKRNKRNLPCLYDDIFKPWCRNWKNFRKTQYK